MRRYSQVLEVFQAAPELVTMLGSVEGDFAHFLASRRPEGPFAEVLPFVHDQAADWEAAAAADATGIGPPEVWRSGMVGSQGFSIIEVCQVAGGLLCTPAMGCPVRVHSSSVFSVTCKWDH